MLPSWGLIPLVALSTAATIIASQAVISGSFSVTRQAIQLGLLPQLDIFQTSAEARGQIYIPQVNWLLLVAVVTLVLGFRSSSALASAYGFAVTGTMAMTTVLAAAVMRGHLAVAVADRRCGAGADDDRRSVTLRFKRTEDPERRLVPAGDRARHVHLDEHLANRPPTGIGPGRGRDDADCRFSRI